MMVSMRCQHELHEHDELGFRALPLGKNSAALDLSPGRLDRGSTSQKLLGILSECNR